MSYWKAVRREEKQHSSSKSMFKCLELIHESGHLPLLNIPSHHFFCYFFFFLTQQMFEFLFLLFVCVCIFFPLNEQGGVVAEEGKGETTEDFTANHTASRHKTQIFLQSCHSLPASKTTICSFIMKTLPPHLSSGTAL